MIQCEKIWLFETGIVDPFFFDEKGGVTATMAVNNPRLIDSLNIVNAQFFMDNVVKAGLTHSISYGGEDDDILESYGKSRRTYEIQMNVPPVSQKLVEKLVGREFSLLAMRRDLSFFVIFARFTVSDGFDIDNEVKQRITFKAEKTNAKIYTVDSSNVENIDESITCDTLGALTGGGFDYAMDFLMD